MTTAGTEGATLAQSIAHQLRDDVLNGRYPPGERLRLEDLKNNFGVSWSPVREAVTRLVSEGLSQEGHAVTLVPLDDDAVRLTVRAGRGADLFESTAAENIGAMILGVGAFKIAESAGWPHPEAWIFFPLVVHAFGLLCTIVAMFFVRGSDRENPMNILNRGYWVTAGLSVVGLAISTNLLMGPATTGAMNIPTWVWYFLAGLVGRLGHAADSIPSRSNCIESMNLAIWFQVGGTRDAIPRL